MIIGHLGDLAGQGGLLPPCTSWCQEIVNYLLMSKFFTCKPTNPKPTLQTPLSNSHLPSSIYPALNHPRPDMRQLGTSSIAQSPLKLFRLANTKLFTVPYLAFSVNHNKGLGPFLSPCSWPSLILTYVVMGGLLCSLLWIVSKLFFQGSCLHVCHLTISDYNKILGPNKTVWLVVTILDSKDL